MHIVSATEAARNFAALLDRAERGESKIVVRDGRPVAAIRPAPTGSGRAVKELLCRYRPDSAWAEEL